MSNQINLNIINSNQSRKRIALILVIAMVIVILVTVVVMLFITFRSPNLESGTVRCTGQRIERGLMAGAFSDVSITSTYIFHLNEGSVTSIDWVRTLNTSELSDSDARAYMLYEIVQEEFHHRLNAETIKEGNIITTKINDLARHNIDQTGLRISLFGVWMNSQKAISEAMEGIRGWNYVCD